MEAARAELDAAIEAIQGVAGYEDFFRPPTWERSLTRWHRRYRWSTWWRRRRAGWRWWRGETTLGVTTEAVWLDELTEAALRERLAGGPAGRPAPESYLACMTPAGARIRGTRRAREAWFAALDEMTRSGRGMRRWGGWG